MSRLQLLFFVLLLQSSCINEKDPPPAPEKKMPLFRVVPAAESGIQFQGHIKNPPIIGGGVAVADINNDGLQDVFFGGSRQNALYLNKGNLAFEDVTVQAGLGGPQWSNGVAMADVNNDGWVDILVTREHDEPLSSLSKDFKDTLNVLLYINNGNLTFSEKAKELGVLTTGPMRHGVFFDFNRDGFLDIYINANFNSKLESNALKSVNDREPKDYFPDFLFLNKEGKRFENVIRTSGITFNTKFRYGFTPYASDFNNDGWVDLYLTNDYDIPDQLFYNKKGKFYPADDNVMPQTSFYTMGADVADINNDGWQDMVAVDMRSEKNYRQKTSWWETPYDWNRLMAEKNKKLEKQQVKNVLQLNRGNNTFSQIGELAGVDATEWSWSPLIADFDNDGLKDIFISNGNNIDRAFSIDLVHEHDSIRQVNPNFTLEDYLNYVRTPDDNPWFVNYIYKNNGDLTFSNKREEWGMGKSVNSTGAAYADFDNDGDLDMVVNNNTSVSFIYENLLNQQGSFNYLRIQLTDGRNEPVHGSRATIFTGGEKQFMELQPVKGFLSQSENIFHFGIGRHKTVDSVLLQWTDEKIQTLKNVTGNQLLKVSYGDAATLPVPKLSTALFVRKSNIGLEYRHEEDDFIDFGVDPLLPQMYSKDGPALVAADLNGDKLDDLLVGGSVNKARACFIQNPNGTFSKVANALTKETRYEDGAFAVFDADGDGDKDVYAATGGFEFPDSSVNLQHRFYINDGKGNFRRESNIPDIRVSSKCAVAADYDGDGDMDLFVAGRIKSQAYPQTPLSFLLKNDNGKFSDVTEKEAPGLRNAGMVTTAVWSDFDGDGKPDLLLAGEYMPVRFFKNDNGTFNDVSARVMPEGKTSGFWNCITAADFDKDGDVDYALGNLGLNTKFKAGADAPLELYAHDFDGNGYTDIISCFNEDGKMYPIKQLRTLTPRINGLAKKYYKTESYGKATVSDIFGPLQLALATKLKAHQTASCYLENDDGKQFTLKPLPVEAQFAPVNAMVADDADGDGNTDLLLVGNFYYAEVERGRYDSFKGLFLRGNGKGNFSAISLPDSGFVVDGDARNLVMLMTKQGKLYTASQNNDRLVTHTIEKK